ncbi:MAG: carboxypeptidase-like regulatory domain-containing protein [Acidobacteria bacterium]|nr:carboxypeptidase-like regulatory domain-containing protein [Acidobacteriota bacterium]
MRLAAVMFLLAGAALGASLGGAIVDNATGRVLAGATVTVRMLQGVGAVTYQARASRAGAFQFPPLAEGQYLLSVTRKGFLPLKYGQKRWNGAARPFTLEREAKLFVELRMQRLAAITGTVLDENDVGISELEVVALRATRPPLPVKKGKTDDRGFYRLGELEPGRYYVRSGAEQLEADYSILPTLHKETLRVDEAIPLEVGPEDVVQEVVVRPIAGRLARLEVMVAAPQMSGPWQVRLMSDTVDRTGGTPAMFDRLAPGRYEIYAEGQLYGEAASGYQEVEVSGDQRAVVQVGRSSRLELTVVTSEGARAQGDWLVIEARRKTLAGTGPAQVLNLNRPVLPAGRWELSLPPNPRAYLLTRGPMRGSDGGVAIRVDAGDVQRVVLGVSLHPAAIGGKVIASLGQPAVGAPVYLEMLDSLTLQRVGELRSTVAGTLGDYRFEGLPPGNYRLLSTFDLENPEQTVFDSASPKTALVKESGQATVDLELFNLP